MTETSETPWMTRSEAASYLRVSLRTFDRLRALGIVTEHGGLPDTRTGTRWLRFHRDDLDRVARGNAARGTTQPGATDSRD